MLRVGSLFAGVGGLEQGVALVLPDARPVWVSEIDPAACRVLAHRYPGVVNHGDITAIDWANVDPVDIICAGWPCQPFSSAGQRKGAADARALWPQVARAVRDLRPRIVVLENVAAIAAAGELGRAVGDLAACGYDAQWRCVRASDVGAPHRRERIFVTAHPAADADGRRYGGSEVGRRLGRVDGSDEGTASQRERARAVPVDRSTTNPAADWGRFGPAVTHWEHLTRPAPAPMFTSNEMSGAFTEWLMGYPPGWITHVPDISNNDAIRLCGNGVVPQQAAHALRLLLDDAQHVAA